VDRFRSSKLNPPAAVPLHRLQDRGDGQVVGAIIGEPRLRFRRSRWRDPHQPVLRDSPPSLWATNLIALLGITFFLIVVVVERIVVRRAPEHVA
jgi:hypothetical protein